MRQYYLVWVVAILILLFLARLLKYRVGRALRALAVSEIASSALGVRNANWKLTAFVANAVFCGFAGGLFAFVYGAVSPQNFGFAASVLPIVMMLVGGDRWIWGGIIGSVIMTWVINGFSQSMLQYNGTVYSVIMILLLLFLPAGILGLRPAMARRLWAKIKGETLQEATVAAAWPARLPSRPIRMSPRAAPRWHFPLRNPWPELDRPRPATGARRSGAAPGSRPVSARRIGPAEGARRSPRARSCGSRMCPCISAA